MSSLREEGELKLDENEYTVDVDGPTTRYVSEQNGIVVEVNGRPLSIQSTAQVPASKKNRGANVEVLPVADVSTSLSANSVDPRFLNYLRLSERAPFNDPASLPRCGRALLHYLHRCDEDGTAEKHPL